MVVAVTVYEYPQHDAHAALVRSTVERLERLSARLQDLNDQWAKVNVEAEGGDGDVVLSVNHKGQLTSLSLAEGCTTRYTHLDLEELLNTTLREAVKAAVSESNAITDEADAMAAEAVHAMAHAERDTVTDQR